MTESSAPDRITVAVVFGGRSNEHPVSCVSASSVISHLDRERYDVVPVGIGTDGSWVLVREDSLTAGFARDRLPAVDTSGPALAMLADPHRAGELVTTESGTVTQVLARADVVFPVLHGPYGEDGSIQGMLELAGVPYVGPGILASASGMDKEFTKKLLAAEGLPVGIQEVLRPGIATLSDAQRDRIGLPAFVKPARGGSSIGISRITRWDDLDAAIALAREHDPKVIVEAAIVGREVECGVLEFPDGRIAASVVAEITLPEGDNRDGSGEGEAAQPAAQPGAFYDFATKYLDDVATFDVPAKLDSQTSDEIRALAVDAFRALDCQGLARVDFFVTADGPVINEINTMPGFTAISMYPRMWEQTGVPYAELLSVLIDTAIARGTGLR